MDRFYEVIFIIFLVSVIFFMIFTHLKINKIWIEIDNCWTSIDNINKILGE